MAEAGLAPARELERLAVAWRLQQDLAQLKRAALGGGADPTGEPEPFLRRLARAGGARDLPALERRLERVRRNARSAFEAVVPAADGNSKPGR